MSTVQIKPTFFSVSGFLAPGIVLIATFALVGTYHHFGGITDALAVLPAFPADSGWAVLLGLAVGAAILGLAFVLGSVLSELFILVGRRLILRPILRKTFRGKVDRVFAHEDIEALVRADMDAREFYVYLHSCGVDLHWYAGRVRMMGATGLSLLLSAIYAWILGYSCLVILSIAAVGLLSIGASLYRSYKFDVYIIASAAVLARGGGTNARATET